MKVEGPSRPGRPTAPLTTLDGLAVGLLSAVVGLLCLAPVAEPDLYFHLAAGRFLAETGHLQTENTWSFTAPGHPFPPTAWLFDLLCYGAHVALGYTGVQVLCAALVAAAFSTVFVGARRAGAGTNVALSTALACAAASVGRFTQRPQVATWLFLALTLVLLREAWRTGRRAPLVAVPLVIALWGNVHAGVVFGAAATGAFLVAALAGRLRPTLAEGQAPVAPWLVTTAGALAATVANPAGVQVVSNAWQHLGRSGVVADIIEFQPPTMTESAAFLFLLGVAVLLLLSTWRRLEVSEVLLLVGFGGAALHERRNMVECLVVLAPLLAARLQDAVDGLARHAPPLLARTALARGAPWLIPPLVLAGGLIAADQPPGYFLRRIQLGENPYRVPSSAAAFVRDHAIAGRCFTSMDLGGFVEWELSDSKVFHDPRLVAYPDELFDELGKAEGNPAAFSALVDKYGIEWSLRSNRNLRFSGVGVFPQERWALVYWDDAASVRVRRDVARFADLVRDSEIREFLPGSSEGELWAASRGERRARLVSEFEAAARLHPTMSAPHTGLCFDLASRREFARAERECDLATQTFLWRRRLEPSEGSRRRRELAVAWTFLGQAALGAGDVVAARRSLEAALEVLPGSGASLAGLGTTWLTEDPARARDLFRRALSAQPGLEQAREGLAKACQTAPGPACPPPAPPP